MNNERKTDEKFRNVLRNDFREINFSRDIKKEYQLFNEFYLNKEKKERLKSMGSVQRWLFNTGWLINSLFLHLTPFRRILVVLGVVFLILGRITYKGDGISLNFESSLLGGIIILFVLGLELKDKLLAKEELEAGREVQKALTPTNRPEFNNWDIYLYTQSANEVGGDLIDFHKFNSEKAFITLADVAGKGLKAALVSAKLQATLRALISDQLSPSDIVLKLNYILHRDSLPNLFASMIYLEINQSYNELEFVNAGHLPPVLIKNGEIKKLEKGNAALGLMERTSFDTNILNLDKDDIFIAFSDGVIEAKNIYGEFFGDKRVINLLERIKDFPADRIGYEIIKAVKFFVGDALFFDDLSIIILKRK